jgi:hypothetical protein
MAHRFPKHPFPGLVDDMHDAFKRHNELMQAATDARMGIDMLCVALRDNRPTPYPSREKLLERLKVLAEILNRVAPRSPLRESNFDVAAELAKDI